MDPYFRIAFAGLAVVFFSLSACMSDSDELEETDGAHDHEEFGAEGPLMGDSALVFFAEDAGLRTSLEADDEGFLTPAVLLENRDFNRVGVRFDARSTPRVEVRVLEDDDRWSPWVNATITYQEETAHNAHADVAASGSKIQLRFRGVEPDELSFLVVDAFQFQREQRVKGVVEEDSDLRHVEQALAVHAGADVTRAQWGAQGHNCGASHGPYRVTVHHTVTPTNDSSSVVQRVRQIQSYHQNNRGWCDIGYHFLIGQDGLVYQGRPEGLRGTHVGGANHGNLGVSFIGTYTNSGRSARSDTCGGRDFGRCRDRCGLRSDLLLRLRGQRISPTVARLGSSGSRLR